jgi:hypothetical protein
MALFVGFLSSLLGFVPVVGFGAALIAFVVDTGKRLGLPDGYAPLVSGGLNLALYGLLFLGNDAQDARLQNAVAAINLIAPYVVALFMSVLTTVKAHQHLAAAGIGYSHNGGSLPHSGADGLG